MKLNLPILEQIADCQNLLVAGMGGGFDVLCGLPIYCELRKRGQTVHLANFSFVNVAALRQGIRLTDTLVGVTDEFEGSSLYFPELYLTRWFKEKQNQTTTVWCFHKTGADPLLKNYRRLIEHLSIDGILLVDGGVDSLMRGDEAEMGTVLEDGISLHIVNQLDEIPVRLMAATAFGAERDITYAHVFENIATLTRTNGFLGSCSLIPQMEVYQRYEDAVLYVQGQPFQDPSVINSSIISAVRGHYGDYHLTEKTHGSKLWISPLMPIYWFFNVPIVAQHNYLLSQLWGTQTIDDALEVYATTASLIPRRSALRIPLP
ncbi:MAG: DUF1152 domain-containing protein [Chloroflexi bacterium]|nr:DUF1152 domain-containing protein [Chloroflexota bacterium]